MFQEGQPEVAHRKDDPLYRIFPGSFSCQVEYLKRCRNWERGIVAVPYEVPVSHSLIESLTSSVFFDIETFYMPEELGFTRYIRDERESYIPRQRLGLAVTIDNHGRVGSWDECQARLLVDYLTQFDRVVSYNGLAFDNLVLSSYASPERIQGVTERTLDLYQYLTKLTGMRRKLVQWTEHYLGVTNFGKSLISSGCGYEDERLIRGFDKRNSIPFILREGSGAQKILAWVACFEDVYNLMLISLELDYEQLISSLNQPDDSLSGNHNTEI